MIIDFLLKLFLHIKDFLYKNEKSSISQNIVIRNSTVILSRNNDTIKN